MVNHGEDVSNMKREFPYELSAGATRVQGLLNGPGSFWDFNSQICILPHSRDFFLSILTVQPQKLIKKIVHQTVLLQLFELMRYGKQSEARKFYELSGENSIQLCDW